MFTFGAIVNEKWENLEAGDGFSVNQFGESPKSGYMVSKVGYELVIPQSVLTFEIFVAVYQKYVKILQDSKENNVYFGAWIDDGKVYFDISQNEQNKEHALQVGKENNQLAIFDLSCFESITL